MLSSTAGTRNGTSDNTINNSKNESVTNEHFGAASTTTNTNNNNSMSINTRQFGTGRGSSETLLSNAELETKGKELQSKSLLLSAALTQKLATSQSGQNLLHMGTSLSSTLPPDLHTLLQNLHPLASSCEATEKCIATELERTVATETRLVQQLERERVATKAAQTLTDLMAAEDIVQRNSRRLRSKENYHQQHDSLADESVTGIAEDELDHAAALERAAIVSVILHDELHVANQVLATTAIAVLLSKEYEQFLVKLAPRIRRLDGNVTQCLLQRMELELTKLHALASEKNNNRSRNNDDNADANNIYLPSSPLSATSVDHHKQQQDDETVHVSSSLSIPVLVLGHLMRALAISGRSKELESVFAKTAVLPILRPNLSVGRLDEGGSRGECAGLTKLLNDILEEIVQSYSPVLVAAESIFGGPLSHINMDGATGDNAIYGNMTQNCLEVDLLTEGVWVPLVSALMSDPGIKMSIFSPGIASILQANFMAFDSFVSSLASRLLSHCTTNGDESRLATSIVNYDTISTSQLRIQLAQDRIYAHPQTAAFAKKWNLPIYYQLRFGECCTRLNKAITQTKQEGWITNVFTGEESQSALLRQRVGFELSLFIELYDALLGLWRPDVILRPLTNRFLRGAVQIVGRVVSFINEGMEGKILFGDEPQNDEDGYSEKGTNAESESSPPGHPTRKPYCWGESEENIAAVAWELALLEVAIRNDYVALVTNALVPTSSNVDSNESEHDELQQLVVEFLNEASDSIHPTIEKAWNHCIVNLLTQKCSTPLAAVKGVAATYRMTNRPPPTQASPFVATILRPLKEFDAEFTNRIPVQIGSTWKHQIIVTLTDRYVAAVDDLIATVRRTEEALKNRKTRRTATGAMSDGEKVKLQLYLDYRAFVATIRDVGIDPASVIGVTKLSELTSEGEKLLQQTVNDN